MPSLEDHEARIQRLEDVEQIRRLKHAYARLVDDNFRHKELGQLFAEDGVMDGGVFGRNEGREAIAAFFDGMRSQLTFAMHFMTGETIDVDPSGTSASGHWYLWELGTLDGQAVWIAMTYNDTYVKQNGKWLFQETNLLINFVTPYEDGWVKTPMLER